MVERGFNIATRKYVGQLGMEKLESEKGIIEQKNNNKYLTLAHSWNKIT